MPPRCYFIFLPEIIIHALVALGDFLLFYYWSRMHVCNSIEIESKAFFLSHISPSCLLIYFSEDCLKSMSSQLSRKKCAIRFFALQPLQALKAENIWTAIRSWRLWWAWAEHLSFPVLQLWQSSPKSWPLYWLWTSTNFKPPLEKILKMIDDEKCRRFSSRTLVAHERTVNELAFE